MKPLYFKYTIYRKFYDYVLSPYYMWSGGDNNSILADINNKIRTFVFDESTYPLISSRPISGTCSKLESILSSIRQLNDFRLLPKKFMFMTIDEYLAKQSHHWYNNLNMKSPSHKK